MCVVAKTHIVSFVILEKKERAEGTGGQTEFVSQEIRRRGVCILSDCVVRTSNDAYACCRARKLQELLAEVETSRKQLESDGWKLLCLKGLGRLATSATTNTEFRLALGKCGCFCISSAAGGNSIRFITKAFHVGVVPLL